MFTVSHVVILQALTCEMKHTTPLFLILMLLPVLSMQTPNGQRRIRELRRERNQLLHQYQVLQKTERRQQVQLSRLQEKIDPVNLKTGMNKPLQEFKVKETAISTSQLKTRFRRDTLERDSNFLHAEIKRLRYEIRQTKAGLSSHERTYKEMKNQYKNKLISGQKIPAGKLRRIDRAFAKTDLNMKRQRQQLLQKFKKEFLNDPMKESMANRYKLLQNGNGSTPAMQSKTKVNAAIPEPFRDKIRNSQEALKLIDEADSNRRLAALDTQRFKPNPYRQLPFRARWQFRFGWQTHPGNRVYPSGFEIQPGFRFLLHPKWHPQVALVARIGLGPDLEHLHLTSEGWGLQAGMQRHLFRQLQFGLLYKRIWLPPRLRENPNSNYTPANSLIPAISLQGKIRASFGYDLLYRSNPSAGGPWIIQFQL